jgi:anti-sigma-K factor RskA
MSTPADHDPELRCAEYALGVLDAAERRAFEQSAESDPALAATLQRWQQRLAPLAQDLRPVAVPARVWTRIERDLGFLPAQQTHTQVAAAKNWWNSLHLWRCVGIGASVATVALVIHTVVLRETPPAANIAVAPVASYMVSTLARPDGVAHWTATIDLRQHEMVVVPAVKPTIASGRATELWLIPPGEKPIPLGVFPADSPARMTLPETVVARLSARAVLAVSVEPPGGSPTGQPTGPVVATGPIRGTT